LQNLSHEVTSSAATVEVEPLPSVWGNPTIVDQIFTNLLSNSLKFVEPGRTPKIQIRGDSSQGGVRVFIKDNGIGIAPEHRERVFGMFQRLHSDEKKYPGTGVGLAIVRKGIERIGGWVGILPDEPPGTCFYLDFLSAKAE
jgi:signal transduction histidine kinase